MKKINTIVFDVFGTLVEITEKRRPFSELLKRAQAAGCDCSAINGSVIMAQHIDMAGVANLCGYAIPPGELAFLESQLENEISSIRLFPEVHDVLLELRRQKYKLALCSNLASPYGPPVQSLLPFNLDAYLWSYTVGAVKPDPAIYSRVCQTLACSPGEVLFVGDTYQADYVGPSSYGMRALHLRRDVLCDNLTSISDLTAILNTV